MTEQLRFVASGGGPAGLCAALWLARYLHKVVVVDSGDPRNWETRGINGYLGHQGITSPELRALGREECAKVGVEFVDGIVDTAVDEPGELFSIQLRGGMRSRPAGLSGYGIRMSGPTSPTRALLRREGHVCRIATVRDKTRRPSSSARDENFGWRGPLPRGRADRHLHRARTGDDPGAHRHAQASKIPPVNRPIRQSPEIGGSTHRVGGRDFRGMRGTLSRRPTTSLTLGAQGLRAET